MGPPLPALPTPPPPRYDKVLDPLNSLTLYEQERDLGDPVFLRLALVWPSGVAPTCYPKGGNTEAPG